MAKSTAKRRSVAPPAAPPARRSAAPPPPDRHSAPPPAQKSVPPPAPVAAGAGRKRARGAAPWAARHAAKRAAEAAARNLEPPRPGSARATLRTPDHAENIKARVMQLHDALTRLRSLKKQLNDRFFEAALVLQSIREDKLFDAKGYASFEAFVEREIDLGGRTLVLRLARIPDVFLEAAARANGLEALLAGLEAMEQTVQRNQRAQVRPPSPGRR